MKNEKCFPINIWDDYYEDGYIPDGEIQESYIYVEDSDISLDKRKEVLEHLMKYIETYFISVNADTKMYLYFYDSKVKYPKLIGEEHEWMHFKRWEIKLEKFSHDLRYDLLEHLISLNLMIDDIPLHIYSES
jgi:hypothetical protein